MELLVGDTRQALYKICDCFPSKTSPGNVLQEISSHGNGDSLVDDTRSSVYHACDYLDRGDKTLAEFSNFAAESSDGSATTLMKLLALYQQLPYFTRGISSRPTVALMEILVAIAFSLRARLLLGICALKASKLCR